VRPRHVQGLAAFLNEVHLASFLVRGGTLLVVGWMIIRLSRQGWVSSCEIPRPIRQDHLVIRPDGPPSPSWLLRDPTCWEPLMSGYEPTPAD